MNVKKYRATTTREALEQVKQDLGDDAFVLETRQVRSGGFLGLRSQKQVEISAASALYADNPEDFFKTKTKDSSVRLVDDSNALPVPTPSANVDSREKIMNALAVRAASARNVERIIPRLSRELTSFPETGAKPIELVELSSKEPQIVHPRNQKKSAVKSVAAAAPASAASFPSGISGTALDQIRAELREVKFSINAFTAAANRPVDAFDAELEGVIYEYPFYNSYLELSNTGFDSSHIKKHILDLVSRFSGGAIPSGEVSRVVIHNILESLLRYSGDPLKEGKCLAVIGATGVGKTTTIAKLAARATLDDSKRVELVTLDTYRIAAVEQLKTYAEIIGAGCHVVQTVDELEKTLKGLPKDATVLIDTMGRSPYDLSDQFEVSNFLLNNDKIHKCLAVQATLNPHDGLAALRKFEMYGTDSLIITKLDETSCPGKILETAAAGNVPLSYFCMGQRVPEDIKIASADTLADQLLPNSGESLKMSA